MCRVDHLRVGRSPISCEPTEQILPDPALCPAGEAIVDRGARAVLRRTILPPAAALEHMHDAADHATIVLALDAAYARRQVRLNPSPLLITQPKEVLAHDPDPLPKTNQDRIVRTHELMSSDPRINAIAELREKRKPERRCPRLSAEAYFFGRGAHTTRLLVEVFPPVPRRMILQ